MCGAPRIGYNVERSANIRESENGSWPVNPSLMRWPRWVQMSASVRMVSSQYTQCALNAMTGSD